jgi:hypothetical protein
MTPIAAVVVTAACATGGASLSLAAASPASSRTAASIAAAGQGDQLQLVVPVEGGLVGWCVTFSTPNRSGAKCPVVPTAARPIVAESWSSEAHPAVTETIALTTSAVSAVSAYGVQSPVATRTEPGLPYGLRAAFVEVQGQQSAAERRALTPLGSGGQPIAGLPASSTPAGYSLDSRAWRRPAHAPRGPCELSASPLAGLTAESGRVVLRLQSFKGIIGRPFLSCADVEYQLNSSPLDAGVVLDATHPGSAPAALPLMTPLPGHEGVFQSLGWDGRLLGRRIAGAWLLVEGGSSPQQRLTLLEHLRATVHF